MWSTVIGDTKHPTDYQLRRVTIDLTHENIRQETVQCQDLDDFLGGIARSFKLLAHYEVQDAFAPSAPLIMNLGVFSGTDLMTGLRIFFSAYSPPFAIAGGHMSMRTFLLLVFDGKTDLDYWVDAIVHKGTYYTRDDILGLCKFAGTPDKAIEPVFKDLYGVEVPREDLGHATQRTYLRGLLLERKQREEN